MNIKLATKYYTNMNPIRQRRMESVIIKFLLDKLEDNGITDPADPVVEDPQECIFCRGEGGYGHVPCESCEGTGVV